MFSRTFAILKPGFTAQKVIPLLEEGGFCVHAERANVTLTEHDVAELYAEHVGKDFYRAHSDYMTSGPCTLWVLARQGSAIPEFRSLLKEKIRPRFALDTTRNVMHGSDSEEAFCREVAAVKDYFEWTR